MSSAREIQKILVALGHGPAALATLVAVAGSSYRQPGARCLVMPDGTSIGSISGGCLEEDVRMRARKVLETGESQLAVYDTASENDLVWGTGLGCQGEVRVLIEPLASSLPTWASTLRENIRMRRDTRLSVVYGASDASLLGTRLPGERPKETGTQTFEEHIPAPPSLVVFGAGDDAIPLVHLAAQLGWHITVLDSRPAYATPARFHEADDVMASPLETAVTHASIDARSHAIVMTHRYRDDAALLRALLPRQLAYLGVLGPRRRTERILAELAAEGVHPSAEVRARLFAPVGLDLGGASPETVALSIIAELQAFQSNRTPLHLRDGTRPIHG